MGAGRRKRRVPKPWQKAERGWCGAPSKVAKPMQNLCPAITKPQSDALGQSPVQTMSPPPLVIIRSQGGMKIQTQSGVSVLRDMLERPAKGMHRDRARTSSALHLQTTQQPQRATSPPANPEQGPGEGDHRAARVAGAGSGWGDARQMRAGGRRARCRVVPKTTPGFTRPQGLGRLLRYQIPIHPGK